MMDLLEKFEVGKTNRTYQRVDDIHKINIFLGYNDQGCMSLVITEPGIVEKVESSKIIKVNMNERHDGKVALAFDLQDKSFENLFLVFCNDLIENSREYEKSRVLAYAVARWKYWKEMFQQSQKDVLGMAEIKGLIGELLFLEERMIPKYDIDNSIVAWMGPESGHKDFEIGDTWYEIKSTSEASNTISISSIEQLESEIEGYLVIVRLEKSNVLVDKAIGLNALVSKIIGKITNLDTLKMFRKKLDTVGYEYNKDYDDIVFICKDISRYTVNDEFPRITRDMIPHQICNVSYSLLIPEIHVFLYQE